MRTDNKVNISERAMQFAVRSIQLVKALDELHDMSGRIIARQFLRAATSIGANVQEAQSGESRMDFIHNLNISLKEARESLYWLRLIDAAELIPSIRLQPMIQETNELISILVAIINSAKKNLKK